MPSATLPVTMIRRPRLLRRRDELLALAFGVLIALAIVALTLVLT